MSPRAASKLVPEAPGQCVLRHCSRRFRICCRHGRSKGSEVAISHGNELQSTIRQSANPPNPWLVGARESRNRSVRNCIRRSKLESR
eukprot:11520895-Alexandrium_andersonii.AAC.1